MGSSGKVSESADFRAAGGLGGLHASSYYSSSTTTPDTHIVPSYDANGNILAWTSHTRALVRQNDYDPLGNLVMKRSLLSGVPDFGFSTKFQDTESGLLYYGYRYYDPATGRWPSRDPIEERGGMNLYGFLGNDGVNWMDSLGLIAGSTDLPKGKDIAATWQDAGRVPFAGENYRAMGHHTYTVRVECSCGDAEIKCDVTGVGEIRLNNSWVKPDGIMKGGGPATWEGVYGHEQMHIDAAQKAAMGVERAIRSMTSQENTIRYAKLVEFAFQVQMNAVLYASKGHSSDSKSPLPADGTGYPPRPGSRNLPPKPVEGEAPGTTPNDYPYPQLPPEGPIGSPPPLRPLPPFLK
ncbi:RHS repeat domain-containing protein [Luteolibacter pohnpeiensis]|nr:RHS repeat-associated core domain-containing protein [Luteolibacter pohnpeiensis]